MLNPLIPLAITLAAPPGYSLAIPPLSYACGVTPVDVPARLLINTSLESSRMPIVAARVREEVGLSAARASGLFREEEEVEGSSCAVVE